METELNLFAFNCLARIFRTGSQGRSPSTGQAGGRCRRVRRVRGIGAVGASPRGQAIPVTRRVRAVGASDPLPRGQAILRTRCVRALGASGAPLGAKRFRERAGSVRSGPPMRPSGQSNSRNALGPHSGPPIRLLGAKRSRGAHVAPSLLTFAAGVCMVPFRPRAKRQNFPGFWPPSRPAGRSGRPQPAQDSGD